MSSTKDQYLREICQHVDNIFVRHRLKKELADHFDDALKDQKGPINEAQERVKTEMGNPEEIGYSANSNHKSFIIIVKEYYKRGLVIITVIFLLAMALTIYRLNERLTQTEAQVSVLTSKTNQIETTTNNYIASIANVYRDIALLQDKIKNLLIDSTFKEKYWLPGIYCCDSSNNYYDETKKITIITPDRIPLRFEIKGELPSYIKFIEIDDSIGFFFEENETVQPILSYRIYSKSAVLGMFTRYGPNPYLNMYDLGNGFVVLKTFRIDSILDEEQSIRADSFLSKVTIKFIK